MEDFFKNRITLLLLIVFLLLILLTLLLVKGNRSSITPSSNVPISSLTPNPSQQPSSQPVGKLSVTSITPQRTSTLTPGQTQTFEIDFNRPFQLSEISISLKLKNLATGGQEQDVLFSLKQSNNQKSLVVSTNDPIISYGFYTLTIVSNQDQSQIFQSQYLGNENR